MSEVKEEKAAEKKQTPAEMEIEIKKLEIEAKRLEVMEREANLQDVKERLAERQLHRDLKGQRSKINAATLAQVEAVELQKQRKCTHRKGGNGLNEFMNGRGQSQYYAVIQHTMLNGDMWVRCMRCGKTWKPPIEKDFKTAQEFQIAVEEYQRAKRFETNNTPSSSYIFGYSDGGAYSREVLRPTTLR